MRFFDLYNKIKDEEFYRMHNIKPDDWEVVDGKPIDIPLRQQFEPVASDAQEEEGLTSAQIKTQEFTKVNDKNGDWNLNVISHEEMGIAVREELPDFQCKYPSGSHQ